MLEKEILRKMVDEQPLTAAETLRLDQALEADDRSGRVLGAIEDAAPSYAWRSGLNQRLAATRRAPRVKLFFGWAGGLTAVAASVIAVVMTQHRVIVPTPHEDQLVAAKPAKSTFEETLLSSHMQGASQSAVGEAPVQDPDDQVFDWSQLDKS